jgi:Leucine-rich repeat (LRR) protein
VVKMLHVPLAELPRDALNNCGNLRNLTIQSAYIERLPAGLFAETPLIELIDLAGNKLANISSSVFTGLTNLRTLRLLANRITAIDSAALRGLSGLEVLQLHQNQLREIGGDLFRDLTRLETLHLYQNQIQAVLRFQTRKNSKVFAESEFGKTILFGYKLRFKSVFKLKTNIYIF